MQSVTRKRRDLKTVILAGGLGTRLREETEFKPKPMVEIGEKPVLWHIMKTYATFGFKDFLICTGYKGEVIKDYFLNYQLRSGDLEIDFAKNRFQNSSDDENLDWHLSIRNTGQLTNTGGRIFRVRDAITSRFFCTYGDGLSNINIGELVKSHVASGKIATLTAVNPASRFGVLKIAENSLVEEFEEKPANDQWVNGGYFVFEPEIFDYMDENCVLESDVLARLASAGELNAFKHSGFWRPMDTYREFKELNELWERKNAPWKIWN